MLFRKTRLRTSEQVWSHGELITLGADASGGFRGFLIAVLQISIFSLGWVFFQHVAAWFQAKVVAKGGDIKGMPVPMPGTATVAQAAPQQQRTGFWGTQQATATAGQRDFSEFR
jgi:hypothetical protein